MQLLEREPQFHDYCPMAVAAGVASIDDDEFTLVGQEDIEAMVTGLGAKATVRSSRRRAARNGSGA